MSVFVSFFAPFLLILQAVKCKIGCKSETKEEQCEEMKQEEIEMLAFFYLCGQKDQNILMKKEKMTFMDFQRFDYLTRRLGFWEYNKRIWKEFSGTFKEKITVWGACGEVICEVSEEIENQKKWWETLSKNNEELLDSKGNYC